MNPDFQTEGAFAPDEVEDALDAYYELSRGEAMDQAEDDAYDRAMTFSGYD